MTQNSDDGTLSPLDTPYLNWAKMQEPTGAAMPFKLQPALVQLRDDADALGNLTDAVNTGLLRLNRDDFERLGIGKGTTAEPESLVEPFTVYWPEANLTEIEAHFGATLEILQLGRPIEATPEPFALASPPKPEAAENQTSVTPIVAVIDDGIGFLNTRFCRRDDRAHATARYRSRFHAIWLQAFRSVPNPSYGPAYVQAGQVLHRREIDALLARGTALEEGAAYRALNLQLLEPGAHRSSEYSFTHGTHILDVAAGADPESDDPALAWPLLAVQLPPEAVDNTAGTQLEPCIVDAVRWILRQARRIDDHSPVVINISFATFAGPKDGTKAIEAMVAWLLERWQIRTGRIARAIYAFGNSRLNQQAARFELTPGQPDQIDWRLQPDDFAPSYLEIRPVDPADMARLSLTLSPPDRGPATTLGPIPPNTKRLIKNPKGHIIGAFYHMGPRRTAPGVISPAHGVVAMAPSAGVSGQVLARAGGWTLGMTATGSGNLTVRLEVQRGDTPSGYRLNGRQSYLDHPLDSGWEAETASYTLPEPGCPITREGTHSSFVTAVSDCVYAVGAARVDTLEPSRYSATGAPWTRVSPTLAAFGDRGTSLTGLVASGTYSGSGRLLNGTSVAAARTTRTIATAMAEGTFSQQAGAAEVTKLIADYGTNGSPAHVARQGAGILTAPGSAHP